MALWKFVTVKKKLCDTSEISLLSRTDVEAANKGVSDALQLATEKVSRGKYNSYTPQQKGNTLLRMALRQQQNISQQPGVFTLMNLQQED